MSPNVCRQALFSFWTCLPARLSTVAGSFVTGVGRRSMSRRNASKFEVFPVIHGGGAQLCHPAVDSDLLGANICISKPVQCGYCRPATGSWESSPFSTKPRMEWTIHVVYRRCTLLVLPALGCDRPRFVEETTFAPVLPPVLPDPWYIDPF